MGWKKDFKKQFNERRKSIFDYSDGVSSVIIWERSYESPKTLLLDDIRLKRRWFDADLAERTENYSQPEMLHKYNYVFNSLGVSEYFEKYLTIGDFENTVKLITSQHGEYAAQVVLLMLKKWVYFTEIKFWDVYNITFMGQKEFDENIAKKIFEAMKLTGLEAIDGMLNKANELLETVSNLDPYRHYLMIEELIDIGEDFTWHWSKMLDQIVDSAIAAMYNETISEEFTSDDTIQFDSTFDNFFEKTKTMVLNDELDEAMEYFGMTFASSEGEFKKIYRTLAKQYHPDINRDPSAAVEMKRINMYKTIIEDYFSNTLGG
jgi:hypothetical protein